MKVTGVRVQVTKTVSDGHYGNERFEAQYIAELDEGEDADEAIRTLSARGRANVVGQLAESESASIRYQISPPKDVPHSDSSFVDSGFGVCSNCGDGPTALNFDHICNDCLDDSEPRPEEDDLGF